MRNRIITLIFIMSVIAVYWLTFNFGHKCARLSTITWSQQLDCYKVPKHKDALQIENNTVIFKIGKDIPRVSDSWKNELRDDQTPKVNSTISYEWKTLFTKSGIPKRKESIVIAQWHDRKVGYEKYSKEEQLRAKHSRPPISIRVIDHKLVVILWNDRILDLQKGEGHGEILFKRPLVFDQWYEFKVLASWSPDKEGSFAIDINDQSAVSYKGPIGYKLDTVGPYFKFGIYTVHAFEGYMFVAHKDYGRVLLD